MYLKQGCVFKVKMNFTLYLFFAIFGIYYCSDLNSNQISKSLFKNLKRKLTDTPANSLGLKSTDYDYRMLKFFFHVPFDVASLYLKYLDEESISLLMNNFEILNSFFLQNRLASFNPFFLFEAADQNMNQIMYAFLNKFVFDHGITRYADLRMKDVLCDLHYDSIHIKSNVSISDNILRCFLHEMFHGTSEPMINSSNQWISYFIRNLFDSQSQMPRCARNYLHIISWKFGFFNESADVEIIELEHHILRIINFFATNPNDSDLLEFYRTYIENDEIIAKYASELKLAVIFKLKLFKNFDMQEFKSYIYSDLSQSHALMTNEYQFVADCLLVDPYSTLKEETKPMKGGYENEMYRNQLLKYLWSRDLQNPFDVDEFSILSNGDVVNSVHLAILEICSCVNPSLIHLEILRQLIRLNVYDFRILRTIEQSPLYKIFWNENTALLELILDEVSGPVNFFILNSEKYQLINNAACVSARMHVAFMKNVKIDDPLSLFVIAGFLFYLNIMHDIFYIDELKNCLEMLKERISKTKFNIDNLFIIDIDAEDFQSANSFNNFYYQMQGKCLSFKQIVYHLSQLLPTHIIDYASVRNDVLDCFEYYPVENHTLNNVFDFEFTSEDTKFLTENEVAKRPVYSLAKLINLGVLEI